MSDVREVSFFVPGKPATKGSTIALQRPGRRAVVQASNRPAQDAWAGYVASAARRAMGDAWTAELPCEPWTGPVAVGCQFVLPARAATTTAVTNGIGDLDKLMRCVWDALTGVVFADDVQVVLTLTTSKRIARAELGEQSGCMVTVLRLDDDYFDEEDVDL